MSSLPGRSLSSPGGCVNHQDSQNGLTPQRVLEYSFETPNDEIKQLGTGERNEQSFKIHYLQACSGRLCLPDPKCLGVRLRSTPVSRRTPEGSDHQNGGLGAFVSNYSRLVGNPLDRLRNGSSLGREISLS